MTRWHLLDTGRIVASVDLPDGMEPDAALRTNVRQLIVSDTDWRTMHHRAALRGRYQPVKSKLAQRLEA